MPVRFLRALPSIRISAPEGAAFMKTVQYCGLSLKLIFLLSPGSRLIFLTAASCPGAVTVISCRLMDESLRLRGVLPLKVPSTATMAGNGTLTILTRAGTCLSLTGGCAACSPAFTEISSSKGSYPARSSLRARLPSVSFRVVGVSMPVFLPSTVISAPSGLEERLTSPQAGSMVNVKF